MNTQNSDGILTLAQVDSALLRGDIDFDQHYSLCFQMQFRRRFGLQPMSKSHLDLEKRTKS